MVIICSEVGDLATAPAWQFMARASEPNEKPKLKCKQRFGHS